RYRRQRPALFDQTLAALQAHANLDRVWKSNFGFFRLRKITDAPADRIRIGVCIQKSLRGIARKISTYSRRSAAPTQGSYEGWQDKRSPRRPCCSGHR